MIRLFCKGKIHRATVTEARLHYEGSVTIDKSLLEAAGIAPYEIVQVTNIANGTRWKTYALAAEAGSGVFCLNGPPARHFQVGDTVIVICEAMFSPEELAGARSQVAFVGEGNQVVRVEEHALGPA